MVNTTRIFLLMLIVSNAIATPLTDSKILRDNYQQIFPQLKFEDYIDGVYSLDPIARASWEEIKIFPPYEFELEAGEKLFTYAECFENQGLGIAQTYPRWDVTTNEVITLAVAINRCRLQRQQAALPYLQGELVQVLAYMASTSRGKKIKIEIPNQTALQAYTQGKAYYYQRRGQLNFSCASCHVQNAGKRLRAEILSPMLGHTTHWPTYRLKWGNLGTLQRRIIACHQQIRANIPKAQSVILRNLEYFLSYMNNGLPMNAPSIRK